MSKKRRTKKQKLLAELKRSTESNSIESKRPDKIFEFKLQKDLTNKESSVSETQKKPSQLIHTEIGNNHSYVLGDIKSTLIITSTILVMNLTFFTLLQINIMSLKFLGL